MLTVNSEDRARIAPLFADMEDTMIRSCLQGRMGEAYADALPPACAQILLGDFAFLAGDVQASGAEELVRHIPRYLLVIPKEPRWGPCLQSAHGERCRVVTRYATARNPRFDREFLGRLADALPEGVHLEPLGERWYGWSKGSWGRDLCSQFPTFEAYERDGIGFVVVRDGEVLSGASSYSVYDGGIEIEIDTREDCRRRGLAAACAARLILACLDRGWYPTWDAANPASAALAEKLGYRVARAYAAYAVEPPENEREKSSGQTP